MSQLFLLNMESGKGVRLYLFIGSWLNRLILVTFLLVTHVPHLGRRILDTDTSLSTGTDLVSGTILLHDVYRS